MPSAAGAAPGSTVAVPSAVVRTSPTWAVPAGARPEIVSFSPATTPSGEAAIVALTTSAVPLMNGCSVQRNG